MARPVPTRRAFALPLAALLLVLSSLVRVDAANAADPSGVQFTLEGCRLLSSTVLPQPSGPNAGKFVCSDSEYTTGNLGKNWNELDLVPYRLTADSGGPAQTYTVVVALDREDVGRPGYDVITEPVLNTALSDAPADCQLSSSGQLVLDPGVGGIDKTIYRALTVTQAAGANCVWDYAGRLALGSHLFPGSSLHANLLNENLGTAGIGSKEVSIPVKEIEPQELDKSMTATQGETYAWSVNKSTSPTSLNFGNTCGKSGADLERSVKITVSWTRSGPTPSGDILITTQIKATNPAHRVVTVNVTDEIYGGATPSGAALDTANSGDVDVPANTSNFVVLEHQTTVASGTATEFNDVATATYTDKVTGIPVPGTTTATAQSGPIQNSNQNPNDTAVITDVESITGDGLSFSVDATSGQSGTFNGGYTLGDKTTALTWTSDQVNSSGSVEFEKTVYLDQPRTTSGTLTDTATLTHDLGSPLSTRDVPITAEKSCGVIKVQKVTVPASSGDEFTFSRNVTTDGGPVTSDFGLEHGETETISDVVPNAGGTAYTVGEDLLAAGQPANYIATDVDCFTTDGTTADADSSGAPNGAGTAADASVHVSAGETVTCRFENTKKAEMIVRKETDPASAGTAFDFTTNAPGSAAFALAHGEEDSRFVPAGTYTAAETNPGDPKPGYRLSAIACDDGDSSGDVGSGEATYQLAAGEVVKCTFTNRLESSAILVDKTGSASGYHGDPVSFTFKVTNPGEQSLHDVEVSDDRCSPLALQSKSEGPNDTGAAFLDPGDTWTYTCTTTLPSDHAGDEQNPRVNVATAKGKDERDQPVQDTDPHETRIHHIGVGLQKDGPAEATAGQDIPYDLTVTNTGDTDVAASDVAFDDPECDLVAPARVSVNGDASPNTFNPGDVWTYRCAAMTTTSDTQVHNVADVCVTDVNGRDACATDDATTVLRQPVQQVAPQRVVAGRARLAGPTRCVRLPFGFRITGSQIESATLYVGKRKVKTLTSGFVFKLNPATVGYKPQRVRVLVRFTPESGTPPRTIRAGFQRCPLQRARPQFTG